MQIQASFDDGGKLDTRIADLMEKYGIETIFYIPFRWKAVNGRNGRESLTVAELRDIASRFEIGAHTITHQHLTRMGHEQVRAEIIDGRKAMQDLTRQEVKSFCPPRGYFNDYITQTVKDAGHTSLRTVRVGNTDIPGFEVDTTVHVYDYRIEYDGSWLDYARKKLAEARAKDGYFHIWGHAYEIDKFNQWDNLELFLKELT